MQISTISQDSARFRPALVLVFLLLVSLLPLSARLVRDWTYKDLLAESDLVAVAEPVSNENNSDQWEWTPKFAQGITTSFKVACYLKGVDVAPAIRVRHFIYVNGWPPNGGEMVNFMLGPFKMTGSFEGGGNSDQWLHENVHPMWLIFLKKSADGTYVPTSGQIDPAYSFRELHGASMYNLNHGVSK